MSEFKCITKLDLESLKTPNWEGNYSGITIRGLFEISHQLKRIADSLEKNK